jgi:transposase
MHLARLLRLDEIVSVSVPSVEREAARDLVRARDDVRGDLMRARHRVSKLLLRQGIVYYGGKAWTGVHQVWLQAQHFDAPGLQFAYDAAHEAVLAAEARRGRLDKAITAVAADSEFTPVVHRLGCLRGVSTLTAFGLAVEVGDWDRLPGASIGHTWDWCPPSPPRDSPAPSSITKTGNTHARRLLVEAAWHHRKPYRSPGATMKARWELAPAAARARGHAGNQRLHQRWLTFTDRKKKPVIANVAIARELAGWCWSLAVMDG